MLSSDTHIDDFKLPWMTLNGVIVLILRFFHRIPKLCW